MLEIDEIQIKTKSIFKNSKKLGRRICIFIQFLVGKLKLLSRLSDLFGKVS